MKGIGLLIAIGVVVLLVSSSAYMIWETEQVIITQFGRPVGDAINQPGLHFKVPFLQKANFFDKRFLEWDGSPNQVPTRDKRFIWVNIYARWRISDPLLFFQRLRDERGAQSRLDDILDGEVRNAVANHDLEEVVRSTNRQAQMGELEEEEKAVFTRQIQTGREGIRQEILAAATSRVGDLGMEILDVRFKRLNYVEEVRAKVYERMITERKRIADKFRSEGQGEASRITGEKERDLKKIQSEAYRTAQEIIGDADAKATQIYASAYNRSADSQRFYSFLKTMETYQSTLDKESWLILSTDGDFYKYIKKAGG